MNGIILICMYFLPALIGNVRHHRSGNSITIINLFLGWTVIIWVICLAWSLSGNVEQTK